MVWTLTRDQMKIFAKASCKIFVAHELGAYSVGIGKGVQHDITNYKDIVRQPGESAHGIQSLRGHQ